jgi:hypothetical protein
MKRCISVIGAAVLFVSVAAAQDWAKFETSLDYTGTRFDSATNVRAFNANGGSGDFAYNFNRWFSGVIDLGAVHNGNVLDSTVANYLGGPRITVHRGSITPYFQVLAGGVYATSSTFRSHNPRRRSNTARHHHPRHSAGNRLRYDGGRWT